MTFYRHDRWRDLLGAVVEVRQNGTVIRQGLVEDVMLDSSAIWIAADGLTGRALIEAAEGHEVWVEPRQLEGKRAYRMTVSALRPGEGHHIHRDATRTSSPAAPQRTEQRSGRHSQDGQESRQR